MPLMSGGDAVVRSLIAHGISSLYCLPGVQSDHLFNALFDAGDGINATNPLRKLTSSGVTRRDARPARKSEAP